MSDKCLEVVLDTCIIDMNSNQGRFLFMINGQEYSTVLPLNTGYLMPTQGHALKVESSNSKTGLMCSACFKDVDNDAVFCKYCGTRVK